MELSYYEKIWSNIKDKEELKKDINQKVLSLYQNKDMNLIHYIFESSSWSKYIDLSYKKSSLIEFASFLKEDTNIEELKYLLNWAENNNKKNEINHDAMHNIVLSAVLYNKINTIRFICKEQDICKIDFSYANYGIITNCFPKKDSPIKKDILKFFIVECDLKKTTELEKMAKNKKRDEILVYFNKVDLYNKINNKIPNNIIKDKKIKI